MDLTDRDERRRADQRKWKKAAYHENPEKFRARARARRRDYGPVIREQHRQRTARKSAERRARRAAEVAAALGRPPQTLAEWWPTQTLFRTKRELAKTVGVRWQTLSNWLSGKHAPTREHRRRLFEITGLGCFAPLGDVAIAERAERRRAYERAWHKAAYAKNPEKFRERARARRRDKGEEIKQHNRQRAAEKAAQMREQKAAEALAALGRPPQTLAEWWPTQTEFRTKRQLARVVGVSRRTVFDWLRGKHPPVRGHRRKLYEISELKCYEPTVHVTVPEKRPPSGSERKASALLEALVVNNGFSPREIRLRGGWQADAKGVRTPGARFIPWGDGRHQVPKELFEAWVSAAQPRDYLFFRYTPVDRGRPATTLWILGRLHEAGVPTRRGQVPRMLHFAVDFLCRGGGSLLLTHFRKFHSLSRPRSWELAKKFTAARAALRDSGYKAEALTPELLLQMIRPGAMATAPERKTRGKSGRNRLPLEERRFFMIAETVERAVPEMERGLRILSESKKKNPPAEAIHKEQLTKAGFNQTQIEALLASKTPTGAAQRYVALILKDPKHPKGLRLKTVQDACARHRSARGKPS